MKVLEVLESTVVKLLHYKEKQKILSQKIKCTRIYVTEDYSDLIMKERVDSAEVMFNSCIDYHSTNL